MQEPHGEGQATHTGPESCAGARKGAREALTGERAGRVLSRENRTLRDADAVGGGGRPHSGRRYGETDWEPARSEGGGGGPRREVCGLTPAMNGSGQSDSPIVPTKFPNKAGEPAAEGMEGEGLAKGNPSQQTAPRAQDRVGALSALERVRQGGEGGKQGGVTTPLHHLHKGEALRPAYYPAK